MWWRRRRRALKGLDEDLRDHIARETEEGVARGMTPEEARRQAVLKFGNVALVGEDTRDVWTWSWLEQTILDVRYALRRLSGRPGFTAGVILTLGLGLGGTTAVFSVVDALFLRSPEGVRDPDSVRRLFVRRDGGTMMAPDGVAGMWPDAQSVRDGSRIFAGVAAYQRPQSVDLGRGPSAARIQASVVSPEFFTVLGARPALGRLFRIEDGTPGGDPVAVISHGMWQNRFGGDRDVLGRALLVNNSPLQVIGVTARGFHGLDADPADLWVPAGMAVHAGLERDESWQTNLVLSGLIRHVARLAPDQQDARAASDASAVLARAAGTEPSLDPTPEVYLTPVVLAAVPGGPSWVLDLFLWLLVAAGFVLAIGCANVANLLLARGVVRRREFAVRLSLGAARWRIVRQELTESAVLALLGGIAGLGISYVGLALMQQVPLPPAAGRIDGRLLAFAVPLSLLAVCAFGVLPAWRSTQVDPVRALKGSHAPGALSRNRTRTALVVVQVALSFPLLVGAALFFRSLDQVSAIRGGADLDRLLTVEANLSVADTTPSFPLYDEFFRLAVSRVSTVQGVERAAVVYTPPFYGWGWAVSWRLPGQEGYQNVATYLNLIGPGYFETTGTRLIRGRTIQPSDGPATEPVAVVNDALARLLGDMGDPLGLCLDIRSPRLGRVPCLHIVGVVESQRNRYLDPEPMPMIFRAVAQVPQGIPNASPMLIVRTTGSAASRAMAVRQTLQGLQPDLPYISVSPLAERLTELRPFQLGATLFAMFGVLALTISAIGLYAVLGYFVAERTNEVGVRRALGSPKGAVIRIVMRQSLAPVIAGLAIGLGAAWAGGQVLESRLFGIGPHDPIAFVGSAMCLIAVAVLATVVPAWRAARIDPMLALRQD
jgi:predicted permease